MNEFNWKQFHKDLDTALATWITEVKGSSIHAEFLDFLKFSNEKQLDQPTSSPEVTP